MYHDYMIASQLATYNADDRTFLTVTGDKIAIWHSFTRLQRLRRNIEPSIGNLAWTLHFTTTTKLQPNLCYAKTHRAAPALHFVQLSSDWFSKQKSLHSWIVATVVLPSELYSKVQSQIINFYSNHCSKKRHRIHRIKIWCMMMTPRASFLT